MSTTDATDPAPAVRRINSKIVVGGVAVLVVVALALDTTYKEPGETSASGRATFDPVKYGQETFPKAAATVEKNAIPIADLLGALRQDQQAASAKYGKREGASPYSFSVSGEGVAGKAEGGLLEVRVPDVPDTTRISVQIGPAINGTAIRDAVGFIKFGQFTNQVEYAGSGTALNQQVKNKVLKGLRPANLEGKKVSFTGAFTLVTSSVVTVTPVKLEVAG
jgi:predicted lipoprotein